jgi:tetratricopeptide (TPR) repeat protein
MTRTSFQPTWARAGIFALAVLLQIVAVQGRTEAQEGVQKLFQEGIRNYREGNYDQAIKEFENLFKSAPTNDAIVDVLDEIALSVVVKMVADDDRRISGIGRTFFRIRREKNMRRNSDPQVLNNALGDYFKADAQNRHRMRIEYPLQYGRNIVPGLVSRLASPDAETRTAAEMLIAFIGLDAVPVLAVASHHPDPKVRSSVARLMGTRNIRHPYNVATLATLSKNDDDSVVRDQARESLTAILEEVQGQVEVFDAKLYHYENARQLYLNPHNNPFATRFYEPVVYSLQGKEVLSEPVASFQLSERMAETSLHEALKLDPDFDAAWAMLACTEAMHLVEYDLNLGSDQADPEDLRILASQKGMIQMRAARLSAITSSAIYEGLGKALEDQLSEVASRILQSIKNSERRGRVPNSLVVALNDSPSREVRVRAAVALAGWRDAEIEPVGQAMVKVLTESVLNSGVRTAHKIMGRTQDIGRFDVILRSLNVDSFSNTVDVETGITRARDIPPDFIVIDSAAQSDVATGDIEPLAFFIRQVRKNRRTSGIPIVVIVESNALEQANELYQSESNKVFVVTSDIDVGEFRSEVLAKLFQDGDDPRADAEALSTLAANTLAGLARANRDLPLQSVAGPLQEALSNRPDSIRVKVIETLGFMRGRASAAATSLAEVFAQVDNADAVREAAMLAVGRILEAGNGASDVVLNVILEGMKNPTASLREASFFAFSAAGAPGAQRVKELFDLTAPEVADTSEEEVTDDEGYGEEGDEEEYDEESEDEDEDEESEDEDEDEDEDEFEIDDEIDDDDI